MTQTKILHETIKVEQSSLIARKNYATEELRSNVEYSCPHIIIEI